MMIKSELEKARGGAEWSGVGGSPQNIPPSLFDFIRPTQLHTHIVDVQLSLPDEMATPPPKRQKRDAYRRNLQNQYEAHQSANVEVAQVKMPQKKFFRQRAHANPFSDHNLD